jgi:general secretion pathway protein A
VYTEFYGLKEAPFNLIPSPRFLYLGEGHKEALELLTHGIRERKGLIVLTGDVGTGKTTVVQALLGTLDKSLKYVYLSNPLLSPEDFVNYVASSASEEKLHFKSGANLLVELEEFLRQCREHQKTFTLIIDEAHGLSFALLEEIRLLSDMEYAGEKLLTIVLVGLPELNEKLSDPRCRPLLQGISHRYRIPPLDIEATREYMATRLKTAGAQDGEAIFSTSAIEAIHEYSRGYPRVINVLADNSLLLGYSRGQRPITAPMVEHCYGEMNVSVSPSKEAREIPQEAKRVAHLQIGRFRRWAALLAFLVVIGAVAVSQRGRDILRELSGFKPAGHGVPLDEATEKLMEEKGDLLSSDEISEQVPPDLQTEAKEAEPADIMQPEGLPHEVEEKSSKAVIVTDGHICRKVVDQKPLDSGTAFETSVGEIYCLAKIITAHSPIAVTHVWYFGGTERARFNLPVASFSADTFSSIKIQAEDIGDWQVHVLGPKAEVLRTLRFEITR